MMQTVRVEPNAFQPSGGTWAGYAALDGLRAVLDPADAEGTKNAHIDLVHRLAIEHAASLQATERVLDLGCGVGRLTAWLGARTRFAVGFDITPEMLRRAANESQNHCAFARFDGCRLPLPTASMKLVVSVYVLQYLVTDRPIYESLLREVRRVLEPGGRCVFIEQVSFGASGSGSVRKHARVADYVGFDPSVGLEPVAGYPVRLGSPGRMERWLLLNRRIPAALRPSLSRASLHRARLASSRTLELQPYVDWLFALRAGPEAVR